MTQPHIAQLTWDYIILALYILIDAVFLYIRWDWISKALSDGDSPSSKRLTSFCTLQALLVGEVYHVIKAGELPLYHLISWLVFMVLCLGLATSAQIIDAWKGKLPPTP